jgi:hypothetical protein
MRSAQPTMRRCGAANQFAKSKSKSKLHVIPDAHHLLTTPNTTALTGTAIANIEALISQKHTTSHHVCTHIAPAWDMANCLILVETWIGPISVRYVLASNGSHDTTNTQSNTTTNSCGTSSGLVVNSL